MLYHRILKTIIYLPLILFLAACPLESRNKPENGMTVFSDRSPEGPGREIRDSLLQSELFTEQFVGGSTHRSRGPTEEPSEEFREYCRDGQNDILSIQRPIESGEFTYRFRLDCQNENFPTIIYIPGGPGETSMESQISEFPENFNIIFTDPRGVGENYSFWESGGRAEDLSSQKIALDIKEIIKVLDLQNYMIHGHSYGTLVATILTHEIESNSSRERPKSLVLEGVQAEVSDVIYETRVFNRVLRERVGDNYAQFSTRMDELMGQVDEVHLGVAASMILFNDQSELASQHFLSLDSPEEVTNFFSANLNESPYPPGFEEVYSAIACREMTSLGLARWLHIENGQFGLEQEGSCSDQELDQPFSLSTYPIRQTPIHLFAGTHDTLTPIAYSTKYFSQMKRNTSVQLYCLRDGGHLSLQKDLSSSCYETFWSRIGEGSDAGELVRDCDGAESVITNDPLQCLETLGLESL